MDTSTLDDRQKECVNLSCEEVLIQKRAMTMEGIGATMGGMDGFGGGMGGMEHRRGAWVASEHHGRHGWLRRYHGMKEICPRGNNKVVILYFLIHDKGLLFMLQLY